MKSILDPSFRYHSSVDTDLRRTFARVRREQRKRALQQAAARNMIPRVVIALREREASG